MSVARTSVDGILRQFTRTIDRLQKHAERCADRAAKLAIRENTLATKRAAELHEMTRAADVAQRLDTLINTEGEA